jgi:hypothetical protein
MPVGKTVKIGVWEDDRYKGVIIYSMGANKHIGSPYHLSQHQICELTRIALKKHFWPVSKMMAISINMLKKHCPKIRLIVSYADEDQCHTGGIYKATNWIYEGLKNEGSRGAFIIKGKKVHPKSIHSMGVRQTLEAVRNRLDKNATLHITKGKHKYLMPLDKEMRKQIEPLNKPYFRRVEHESNASGNQSEEGGAVPTDTLHKK